jgi:large subunit ribosomal protein L29
MEYKEIKSLPLEQLNKKALELKKNLFEMRMKNTMGQLSNPLVIRDTKKVVARVLTAISSLKGTTAVKTLTAPKAP